MQETYIINSDYYITSLAAAVMAHNLYSVDVVLQERRAIDCPSFAIDLYYEFARTGKTSAAAVWSKRFYKVKVYLFNIPGTHLYKNED